MPHIFCVINYHKVNTCLFSLSPTVRLEYLQQGAPKAPPKARWGARQKKGHNNTPKAPVWHRRATPKFRGSLDDAGQCPHTLRGLAHMSPTLSVRSNILEGLSVSIHVRVIFFMCYNRDRRSHEWSELPIKPSFTGFYGAITPMCHVFSYFIATEDPLS